MGSPICPYARVRRRRARIVGRSVCSHKPVHKPAVVASLNFDGVVRQVCQSPREEFIVHELLERELVVSHGPPNTLPTLLAHDQPVSRQGSRVTRVWCCVRYGARCLAWSESGRSTQELSRLRHTARRNLPHQRVRRPYRDSVVRVIGQVRASLVLLGAPVGRGLVAAVVRSVCVTGLATVQSRIAVRPQLRDAVQSSGTAVRATWATRR